MKICTCNNCGKFWEDTNPGNDSIEYPDDTPVDGKLLFMQVKDDPEEVSSVFTEKQLSEIVNAGYEHACPNCKTDSYLTDNKHDYGNTERKIHEANH